jgi:hypothetical protein
MSSTMGSTLGSRASTVYHGGYDAPELVPSPQPEKMVYDHQVYVHNYAPPGFNPTPTDPKFAPVETKPTPTICGVTRGTFFSLALVVLLVIAGAVGGGIGGSMAVQYV